MDAAARARYALLLRECGFGSADDGDDDDDGDDVDDATTIADLGGGIGGDDDEVMSVGDGSDDDDVARSAAADQGRRRGLRVATKPRQVSVRRLEAVQRRGSSSSRWQQQRQPLTPLSVGEVLHVAVLSTGSPAATAEDIAQVIQGWWLRGSGSGAGGLAAWQGWPAVQVGHMRSRRIAERGSRPAHTCACKVCRVLVGRMTVARNTVRQ